MKKKLPFYEPSKLITMVICVFIVISGFTTMFVSDFIAGGIMTLFGGLALLILLPYTPDHKNI